MLNIWPHFNCALLFVPAELTIVAGERNILYVLVATLTNLHTNSMFCSN
jgi:hypothetical protein